MVLNAVLMINYLIILQGSANMSFYNQDTYKHIFPARGPWVREEGKLRAAEIANAGEEYFMKIILEEIDDRNGKGN